MESVHSRLRKRIEIPQSKERKRRQISGKNFTFDINIARQKTLNQKYNIQIRKQ